MHEAGDDLRDEEVPRLHGPRHDRSPVRPRDPGRLQPQRRAPPAVPRTKWPRALLLRLRAAFQASVRLRGTAEIARPRAGERGRRLPGRGPVCPLSVLPSRRRRLLGRGRGVANHARPPPGRIADAAGRRLAVLGLLRVPGVPARVSPAGDVRLSSVPAHTRGDSVPYGGRVGHGRRGRAPLPDDDAGRVAAVRPRRRAPVPPRR
mmetsp:Transcript_15352/g.50192  ORF Transcript_15352/g.50192 Transcript_15352/m.50192 type:complete len:205 (+) Transcript_15352:2500-3114(+)